MSNIATIECTVFYRETVKEKYPAEALAESEKLIHNCFLKFLATIKPHCQLVTIAYVRDHQNFIKNFTLTITSDMQTKEFEKNITDNMSLFLTAIENYKHGPSLITHIGKTLCITSDNTEKTQQLSQLFTMPGCTIKNTRDPLTQDLTGCVIKCSY